MAATLEDVGSANRSRARRFGPAVVLAVVAAALTACSMAGYINGRGGIDLAIFDQGVWTASRDLQAPAGIIQETIFEDHFAPGMLVFVLLYKLVATPLWLLLAQGIAAWVATLLIVYRLRPALGSRSTWVGVALLTSAPVAYALFWGFHSVVLAVPFAVGAFFAIEDGRNRRALLFGLAAAVFRLDVGVACLVAFAAIPGDRRSRLRPAGALLAYLVVAHGLEQSLGHDIFWPMHFGYLGESPLDALAHPGRALQALLTPSNLVKVLPWVTVSGLLCFTNPRGMVPVAVSALPVILSQWPGTSEVYFQYGIAPTVLLAVAAVPTLKAHPQRSHFVFGGSLILAVAAGPILAGPNGSGSHAASRWRSAGFERCLVSAIPADADVAASPPPLTLLAQRPGAYLWPFPFEAAPADTLPGPQHRHPVPSLARQVDYVIVPESESGRAAALLGNEFAPDGSSGNYLRFRRIASTQPAGNICS